MAGNSDHIKTPAQEDTVTEAAVLRHVVSLHPIQLSFDELLREVAGGSDDFRERDATERAVRDLVAAGLLRRSGELVLPSLAALRFDQLLDG